MKAVIYHKFQGPIALEKLPDPIAPPGGVVLQVKATGLCRSDWHGWMGHDTDVVVPHVPGHELAGKIVEMGKGVKKWKIGDRVTLPFVCGCGTCPECLSGNHQVCDAQFQPGFTHWGSFAEYVAIHYAETNLVRLPENLAFGEAASLGCRFITSYRAVVHQGKLRPGQWLAVHGCGGVGLSALLIGKALGARTIAIDIHPHALEYAQRIGAEVCINASGESVIERVKEVSRGGAHLSIDALGSKETCFNSISGLRKRGKHVQVGLMAGEHEYPAIPMGKVIANELEVLGSHGMQAHVFPEIWNLWEQGKIDLGALLGTPLTLEEAPQALSEMNAFSDPGVRTIQFL